MYVNEFWGPTLKRLLRNISECVDIYYSNRFFYKANKNFSEETLKRLMCVLY